jgi:Protein of unknown function (DUF2530)
VQGNLEPVTEAGEPEIDEVTPVAVGTAVWALLFVIGLVIRGDLRNDGREWWIWTAAAGVALGLFGYWFMLRRQARLRAAAESAPLPPREPS